MPICPSTSQAISRARTYSAIPRGERPRRASERGGRWRHVIGHRALRFVSCVSARPCRALPRPPGGRRAQLGAEPCPPPPTLNRHHFRRRYFATPARGSSRGMTGRRKCAASDDRSRAGPPCVARRSRSPCEGGRAEREVGRCVRRRERDRNPHAGVARKTTAFRQPIPGRLFPVRRFPASGHARRSRGGRGRGSAPLSVARRARGSTSTGWQPVSAPPVALRFLAPSPSSPTPTGTSGPRRSEGRSAGHAARRLPMASS